MESITSRISIGNNKRLLIAIPFKVRCIEDNLVEDRDKSLWKSRRASACSNTSRVSHMRLVVRAIEILSIPARREENLSTETARAFDVWQTMGLRSVSA
jgi:hypothetical protein